MARRLSSPWPPEGATGEGTEITERKTSEREGEKLQWRERIHWREKTDEIYIPKLEQWSIWSLLAAASGQVCGHFSLRQLVFFRVSFRGALLLKERCYPRTVETATGFFPFEATEMIGEAMRNLKVRNLELSKYEDHNTRKIWHFKYTENFDILISLNRMLFNYKTR